MIIASLLALGVAQRAEALNTGPYYKFHEGSVYFSCNDGQFDGKIDLLHCGGGHYVTKDPFLTLEDNCRFVPSVGWIDGSGASTPFYSLIGLRLKQSSAGETNVCFLKSYVLGSDGDETNFISMGDKFDLNSAFVPNLSDCPVQIKPGTVSGQPSDPSFRVNGGLRVSYENFTSPEGIPVYGPTFFCRLVAQIPKPTLVNGPIANSPVGAPAQ